MILIFLFGFVIGVLIALLVVVTLIFFRRVIEQKTTIIEKKIENAGPHPKGYVFEPQSLADEARQKIIDRNKAQGRDTPVSDLE